MKQATIMVKQDDGSFKETGIELRPNSTLATDKDGELQSGQGRAAIPQGDHSHAEGQNTLATGIASHAEGGGPDNGAGSSSGAGPTLTFSQGDAVSYGFAGTYVCAGGADLYNAKYRFSGTGLMAGWVIYFDGMQWQLYDSMNSQRAVCASSAGDGMSPMTQLFNGTPSWSLPDMTYLTMEVDYSFAPGSGSGSSGNGLGGLAEGDYAHSEGKETHALGMASHAAGVQSKAVNAAERALAAGMFAERGDAQLIELVLKASAISGGFTLKTADGQDPKFPADCVVTGRMFIATADVINTYEEIDFKIGRDNMTVIWSPATIGTAYPSISSDGMYNTLVLQTTGMFDTGVRVIAVLRALIIKMP